MSNPFTLTDLPNNDWAVSWFGFDEKFTSHMKFNMIEYMFHEIDCDEVGLGIELDPKVETSIMWVKRSVWYADISAEYAEYLYKYYKIKGAVFHEYKDAVKFKELLEKRYAWQLLKE